MTPFTLEGRRALITGGSRGIGFGIAKAFVEAGADVVLVSRGKEGLEKSDSEKPDLYIIDLMMETYSEGSKVVEELIKNEETHNKPRIMITSVDLKGPWDSYPQDEWLSCDFLLQKPVAPSDLLDYIERSLMEKQ